MRIKTSIIYLMIFSFASSVSFAQEKPDFKIYCDKHWNLIAIEEFGVEGSPEDKMKKDEVFFSTDGTAKMKMFGKTTEGKWAIDKTQTFITITDSKNQKTALKVYASSNPENLTLEYKDPDYVKTKMIYESKK
jgi:hypothetical protein